MTEGTSKMYNEFKRLGTTGHSKFLDLSAYPLTYKQAFTTATYSTSKGRSEKREERREMKQHRKPQDTPESIQEKLEAFYRIMNHK